MEPQCNDLQSSVRKKSVIVHAPTQTVTNPEAHEKILARKPTPYNSDLAAAIRDSGILAAIEAADLDIVSDHHSLEHSRLPKLPRAKVPSPSSTFLNPPVQATQSDAQSNPADPHNLADSASETQLMTSEAHATDVPSRTSHPSRN